MVVLANIIDDAESFPGNLMMPDPTQLLNCQSPYLNFYLKAYL